MRKIVAEKLADQIADWGHRGLISYDLLEVLKKRYSTDVTLGSVFLRWLGFLALFMLGTSILGIFSLALGDFALHLAPFVTAVIAYIMWLKGAQMATDPEQKYPTSGAVLLTSGLLAGFTALVMFYALFDDKGISDAAPYFMLVTSTAAFFAAYRYGLRWPLTLGLLLVFHGLGNMHSYGGHGSYFFGVQDERLTLLVALGAIVFGLWHEKALEKDLNRHATGLGHIYIIIGLFYANLCLWILSLPKDQLGAVLIFSAVCVAQIILGGKFHDGRFTGFGIVFLSINIYTRMFETFWDELSKGVFFLIAGAVALTVGVAFELRARKIAAEASV